MANTCQCCDWCEGPIRPGDTTEVVTFNERPFVVHDYCASAMLGIFAQKGNPIDIIDLDDILPVPQGEVDDIIERIT